MLSFLRFATAYLCIPSCVVYLTLVGRPGVSVQAATKEKILFLLVDGLRWDRLGYDVPSLDRMEQNGVRAEWLDGVFITKSAPSMFSIATGLYIENHGVVHNLAFNQATGEISDGWTETMNDTWWFNQAGEPLWITAMSQGLRAGSFMYPGGQTPINGTYPDRYVPYTDETFQRYLNLLDRADVVLDWLYNDDIDVVFLYVGTLDTALHDTGLEGDETKKLIGEVDELIGYILDRVDQNGAVGESLNFILASDHGMAETPSNQAIALYDYVNETKVDLVITDGGGTFQLDPIGGAYEEVYNLLAIAHPALNVFKKEEFPDKFHYADNPRNLALIGYADVGWTIFTQYDQSDVEAAGHGYDNEDMFMKSSFYAQGPSFRKAYRANHFESVNIYPLMCELLGIVPAPNNGSRDNYKDMLLSEHPTPPPVTCGGSSATHQPLNRLCIGSIYCMGACYLMKYLMIMK